MTKERYKDETLELGDAGEKVKRLINEHLISLGINPKVPPVELLAEDFIVQLNRHAEGSSEAKASEMEHAIRKHCTIHFNEDPAFYRLLSQKLEHLIQQHRDSWEELTKELIHLRGDAVAGRQSATEGLTKEQTTFYDHLVGLTFGEVPMPPKWTSKMKKLAAEIVDILQETIGIIDFWKNPAEQARLRGELADALLMADVLEVTANFNRLAIEIVKLAKHRHEQLMQGVQA